MENKVIETMEKVPDPRKGNAVRHILSDILMIGRSSPNKVEQAITNPFKKMRGAPVNHRN